MLYFEPSSFLRRSPLLVETQARSQSPKFSSIKTEELPNPTTSVSLARYANLSSTSTRVMSRLPRKEEADALLRQVSETDTDKLREVGLRARRYKEYLQALEELHYYSDENGIGYIRDDVVQQLRHHFLEAPPGELTNIGLTQAIRSYEAGRYFMATLGQLLFPWTAPYFPGHMALHSGFKRPSRGIALTAGDAAATFLFISIRSLRQLGCTLPIEIMYMGNSDLSEHNRAKLEQLDGALTRDLTHMVHCEGWKLEGWAIKPFAILLSSFREVIFIDADSLFFRDPQMLFQDPAYTRTGALFFNDRMIYPASKKEWLQKILPEPFSEQVTQSRFWTGKSSHMQESGVIVVDKWRHFVALLMVTRMNGPDRDGDAKHGRVGVYDMVYGTLHDLRPLPKCTTDPSFLSGDKETFWLGWELVGDLDYAFHQGGTGTMGVVQEPGDDRESKQKPDSSGGFTTNTVEKPAAEAFAAVGEREQKRDARETATICSPQLLHLGLDGRPLWFNGWVAENKFVGKTRWKFGQFEHFLAEPNSDSQPDFWRIKESNICCLAVDAGLLGEFTVEEQETLNMIMGLAKDTNTTKID